MTKREKCLKMMTKIRAIYGGGVYQREQFQFMVDVLGSAVDDFYSPIPAIYLIGLKRLNPIRQFNHLFVKDGALGLVNFFSRFKEPDHDFSVLFFIDLSLSHLVPEAWRNNVQFFTYYFRGTRERENLLIYGSVGPEINNFSSLEKNIKLVIENFNIKHIDLCLRVPAKIEGVEYDEVVGVEDLLNVIESVRDQRITLRTRRESSLLGQDFSNHVMISIDSTDVLYCTNSTEQQLFTNGILKNDSVLTDSKFEDKVEFSLKHGILLVCSPKSIGDGLNLVNEILDSKNETQGLSDIEVISMIQSLFDKNRSSIVFVQ